jgi:hypothetical protein
MAGAIMYRGTVGGNVEVKARGPQGWMGGWPIGEGKRCRAPGAEAAMGRRVCRLEGATKREKKGRADEWTSGRVDRWSGQKGRKGGVRELKEK